MDTRDWERYVAHKKATASALKASRWDHLNSKSQIDVAILDFSKAFDTVPHAGLFGKLEHYGIDGKILILWIANFLNNRKQRVVVDGSFSNYADVESGVSQGTVLGPLLFLLHINDISSCVNFKVCLFADDCLLYREI